AVGHLDHAEQEPAAAFGIFGREQLAQEQVGAVERAERRLQDVLAEDPTLVRGPSGRAVGAFAVGHRFSTSWKSWNRSSTSPSAIPRRESASRNARRTSTTS